MNVYENEQYNLFLAKYGDMPEGHERCRACFKNRLNACFKFAKENKPRCLKKQILFQLSH